MRRHARWTPGADATLAGLYPTHPPSWEGWAEALPGRTRHSIVSHAARLGLAGNFPGHPAHGTGGARAGRRRAWRPWSELERRRLVAAMGRMVGVEPTDGRMRDVEDACGHDWRDCVSEMRRIARRRKR